LFVCLLICVPWKESPLQNTVLVLSDWQPRRVFVLPIGWCQSHTPLVILHRSLSDTVLWLKSTIVKTTTNPDVVTINENLLLRQQLFLQIFNCFIQ
jgi:hypothetical protein